MKYIRPSRWLRPFLRLLMVVGVTVCLLPLDAAAVGSKGPVICLSTADGENLQNLSAGIPIDLGDAGCVLTSTDLYEGKDLIYLARNEAEDTYLMTYEGELFGLSLFSTDATDFGAFYTNTVGPVQGKQYTLRGINGDVKYAKCTVTVTKVSTTQNSQGTYDISIDGDDSSIASPAVIVDGDAVVAIRNGSRVFSLSQPTGNSGGGGGGGGSRVKPSNDNTALICVGAMVALIVGFAVVKGLRKKRGGSSQTTTSDSIRDDRNLNENGPAVNIQEINWVPHEDVIVQDSDVTVQEKPKAVKLYLEIQDGPMAGQQYPVPDGGALLIGRSTEANIRYSADTKGVSRRHCQVFWNNGSLQVMDLGSTAGTFLRGKGKLIPNTPVPLTEGSVIYLGSKAVAICLRIRSV